MRRAEQFARQELHQVGLDAAAAALTGLDAGRLRRHLEIASRLLTNDRAVLRERATREFLQAEAARSGMPREAVEAALREVLAAPSGEAAARRYAAGVAGNPVAGEAGLSLTRNWLREDVSQTLNTRRSDADLAYHREAPALGDRPAFRHDRDEAANVRVAIERAMVSSGVAAPPARTLGQLQARAQGFAEGVASRLEAREAQRAAGQEPSLRELVEDSYMTDRALAAKADAGLPGPTTMAEVREGSDQMQAQAQTLRDDVFAAADIGGEP
jgi:hypothetical protein